MHRTTVTEKGAFAIASCSCGWKGPARRARDRARRDADLHTARQPGRGPSCRNRRRLEVVVHHVERRTLVRGGGGLAASLLAGGCTSDGAATTTARATRTAVTATTAARSAPDWIALGRGLDGRLIRPADAAYDSARHLYNTRFDGLKPAAIAYISGVADIQECLRFAHGAGIAVSVRNGGHSYAGWSSGNGRLVVDVSALSRVTTGSGSAAVGAGARLIDVCTALAAHGRTIPAGSCPSVGVSGLTLGGGHGIISRAYGLTCDSLTAAEIVTADGRHLTADAGRDTDLFWALRGAGNGQFGVVTALRFRTHAAPAVVTGYLNWPWRRAAAVVRAWQEWGPGQPDEIWSALRLDRTAGGDPTVTVSLVGLTTRDDAANAVDRLTDRVGASASYVSLRSRPFLDATRAYAGCSGLTTEQCHLNGGVPGRTASGRLPRDSYTARSDFYDRSLPDSGVEALLSRMEGMRAGDGSGSVALTALGGAVNRVSPAATAFVHRRSRFLAQYIQSPGRSATAWLDGLHTAMRRYASGAAYQNYTDPKLADWRTAYYGSAAPRLAALRRRYDPDGLFRFPQAL